MGRNLRLLITIVFLVSFLGCAPATKIVVRMYPDDTGDHLVDKLKGTVTLKQEDVKIIILYKDRAELENLSPSLSNNPYMNESKTFVSVFEVTIDNMREEKVSFNQADCVVLDGLGNQLNSLTKEAFKNLYPSTHAQYYTYSSIFNEYTGNVEYTPDYYKRKIVEETMLKGGDLYPGVKKKGFLVFDRISRLASRVTLIIPAVTLYRNNEVVKKIDFKFVFHQDARIIRQ